MNIQVFLSHSLRHIPMNSTLITMNSLNIIYKINDNINNVLHESNINELDGVRYNGKQTPFLNFIKP